MGEETVREQGERGRATLVHLPVARASLTTGMEDRHSDRHALRYRASFPFLGRRYYVALVAGSEQRDPARLASEAQTLSWWQTTFSLSALAMGLSTMLMATLATAYLLKSMLGIDLLEDHFFLHGLFFR
jgi:hypothetical protein